SLGVPVTFAEIQRVSALCEIMKLGNVVPDVSLGSHFFNDLVEENMLYVALYPGYPGHALAEERLRAAPNRLAALVPDDARLADVIHVVDFAEGNGGTLWLNANCVAQEVLCWVEPPRASTASASPSASCTPSAPARTDTSRSRARTSRAGRR
ncbi:MAG TPA: hypothetical protein VD838_05420, partial [Anaeromyxobacteraceae bacterium]|nr:hypothetical protein [Anaeromyxobacteraceae bacterium]